MPINEHLAPPEENLPAALFPLAILLALVTVALLAWVVCELGVALALTA